MTRRDSRNGSSTRPIFPFSLVEPTLRLKHAPESGSIERDRREIEPDQRSLPPGARALALFAGGEVILIQLRTDVMRRMVRKRVYAQQAQNRLIVFEQFGDEVYEPRIVLI